MNGEGNDYLRTLKNMGQKKHIDEKMKEFAMNIEEFTIGQTIIDSDNTRCEISNKTINSIEVSIIRKSEKGSNCKQWFDMKQFNKRFKTLN
ncbi:MAG: hypothetical protein JNJ41_12130 [Bacteroidia bacterium]|nr:hypothetical protein [Sphingobacteriaceae bacterium]MBL7911796.1 hypothetical protein [Bacteroidia bacterium]